MDRCFSEGDKIKVTFTAAALPGFKFLQFNGYNAKGEGKNEKRLQVKAAKIEEALKTDVISSVAVNQYSLEVRENHVGRVMIDIWI